MNEYKYDLSLRIKHPHMDPNIICEQLGLDAKHKWKCGDQRRTPKGDMLNGKYQETYCNFQLAHKSDVALLYLISDTNLKLKNHADFLENLRSSGGVLEYFVGMYFDKCSGEIFDFKILGELAELKIDLSLDLYGSKE